MKKEGSQRGFYVEQIVLRSKDRATRVFGIIGGGTVCVAISQNKSSCHPDVP